MKRLVHHFSCSCFLACHLAAISTPVLAEAPVVDASQNFALFDEQLAVANEQPGASLQDDDADDAANETMAAPKEDNFTPLARQENNSSFSDDTRDDAEQDASADLSKVQALQQELSELRGQLEVQTHALETLKQQQIEFYKDLDNRLRETANSTTGNTTTTPQAANAPKSDTLSTVTTPRGNPADEQISYLAAYDLVKNQEYDKATLAMKSFITRYPNGGYTANAHYWLGEVYLAKAQYAQAIQQFEAVLSKFPTSGKASAASLKMGYALAESGQTNKARTHLQSVIQNYPDTRIAKLAAQRLGQLKS